MIQRSRNLHCAQVIAAVSVGKVAIGCGVIRRCNTSDEAIMARPDAAYTANASPIGPISIQ